MTHECIDEYSVCMYITWTTTAASVMTMTITTATATATAKVIVTMIETIERREDKEDAEIEMGYSKVREDGDRGGHPHGISASG